MIGVGKSNYSVSPRPFHFLLSLLSLMPRSLMVSRLVKVCYFFLHNLLSPLTIFLRHLTFHLPLQQPQAHPSRHHCSLSLSFSNLHDLFPKASKRGSNRNCSANA